MVTIFDVTSVFWCHVNSGHAYRRIAWPELWRAEPFRTRFLIKYVYNVLGYLLNLFLWTKLKPQHVPNTKEELRSTSFAGFQNLSETVSLPGTMTKVLKMVAESINTAVD